jgi:UDP-N-acetylmuramoyl-tripeptide--D-alanyl-D-alanine ligase
MIGAMGGRPVGTLPQGVTGISIDSRTLQSGEAFFAIRGEKFDGHDFATAAMAAGAALLVVAEAKLPALGRLKTPMIVVDDVLKALERVGVAARERTGAKVIAVTGSVGKTTTKEMLRHALRRAGKMHASAKSFNNHWGVPLTLARMPADCDFAVFEIGMNHPGEIRPLVKLVRPHVAIVTLIAPAHLGHFKSLDDIARAKAEIFEGVVPGGCALINLDDPRAPMLAKLARHAGVERVGGFGEHARAAYKLINCELHPEGSIITARIAGKDLIVRIGAPGRHIVQNALAALGAADLVGADPALVTPGLGEFSAESGRGKRLVLQHEDGPIVLIDESYNANPASMKAAIELLDATPVTGEGRRIAVLGDMLELGTHAEQFHAALADVLVNTKIDRVFLAGPEMKVLAAKLPAHFHTQHRERVEDLKQLLVQSVRPGDAIMIKSSLGIGFSKLVDGLADRFPAADRASRTA